MTFTDLPTLNALLNSLCFACLVGGRIQIKRGREIAHRKFMITALIFAILFFASYTIYHLQVGSVPYPHDDWTRPVYFAILIPHVILAAAMVPFIARLVWLAATAKFERHRKLARIVWPVWAFVSVTGVLVYLMLYVGF